MQILSCSLSLYTVSAFADDSDFMQCIAERERSVSQQTDSALIWYRTSAEKTALFRQIFTDAMTQINNRVKTDKLKLNSWGVVFNLDNVLLDDSLYRYAQYLGCTKDNNVNFSNYLRNNILPTNSGAADITCQIQALGGKVFIVSNRNGSGDNGKELMAATVNNLNQQHICYNSILYASDTSGWNKNPRFTAITSGDYENIIVDKPQAATQVIAYFGSNIEDFPSFKQNTAHELSPDSILFDKFGTEYFLVPNPLTGNWRRNYWK